MTTLAALFAPAPHRHSLRPAAGRLRAGFVALGLGLLSTFASAKGKWDAIPAPDLAATECKSYPGSSAEVLFTRQVFDANQKEAWMSEYTRIKVYSSKGAEEAGVLRVEYDEDQRVWDLFARVTKPDGNSTEYGKESFNDAVMAKKEWMKIKRKTLAVPNLGAGDVIEIRFTRSHANEINWYYHWFAQQTVPVREHTFAVENSQTDYSLVSFNVKNFELKKLNRYQLRLEMRDLPPFEEEPYMPTPKDIRGWFLLEFSDPYMRWYAKPAEMWKEFSTEREDDFRALTDPTSAVKAQAAELIRGTASDAEKLQRLYDFCQANVSNMTYFDSAEIQLAKKKLGKDDRQDPEDTLKRKTGYARHINELFAALARAAGCEVRLGHCANRNDTLNVQNAKGRLFVYDTLAVVKVGEKWTPYSPGSYYAPAGLNDPANEMAPYLRCEKEQVVFDRVPVAPAEKSAITRRGRFRLDTEGTLEGEVEIRMAGHEGGWRKHTWGNKQTSEIDSEFQESITQRLRGAEISEIAWENLKGNTLPLVVRYKVKVTGYAEVAGARIVLTPAYFAHGRPAFFSATTRKHPIVFTNTWAEHDDVEILLPEGFALEAPSSPADVGDLNGVLGARYKLGYKPKSRQLFYHRDFALGGNGVAAFQAASYPKIKAATDAIARSDEHSLVLKPTPRVSAPEAVPADAAR